MYDDDDTDTITDDDDYDYDNDDTDDTDDTNDDEYPHDDDYSPYDLDEVIESKDYIRARRTLGNTDIPAWPFILGSAVGAVISAYVAWDQYDMKVRNVKPENKDWKPCLIASFVCMLFIGAFITSVKHSK